MAEEVIDQHGTNARAHGARGQHDRDRHDASEEQRHFSDVAPFGAAVAENFAGQGQSHQEDAADDQGKAVKNDVPRDVDIDCPAAVANGRDGDQRGGDHCGAARASRTAARDAMEKSRIGVQHEVVKEHPAKGDAEQIDVPARLRRRIKIEVFQQQNVADGEPEPNATPTSQSEVAVWLSTRLVNASPPTIRNASRPIVENACRVARAQRPIGDKGAR